MSERQCPDDLLVAGRSRWLTDLERQVLTAHLARCELCRAGEFAAAVFRDPLVGGGAPLESDRALVERVAERASTSVVRSVRRARPGWRRAAVAVAVFLGLGGVASAWIGRSLVSTRAAEREVAPNGATAAARARRTGHAPTLTVVPTPPAAAVRPPAPVKRIAAVRPLHESAGATAAPETPASLFAEAARARHDGDSRRAVAVYGTLRSTFPDSDQARVAAVSMGDLLLRLDEPAGALHAFDAYLAGVRGGALHEEALFGRARCLKMLGDATVDPAARRAEEETWARLLREFPSSVYGRAARQRLDELRQSQ